MIQRMTPSELRAERKARQMTGKEFGAFLADLLGDERPYSRQEINAWECGRREIPALVELALLRLRLDGAGEG